MAGVDPRGPPLVDYWDNHKPSTGGSLNAVKTVAGLAVAATGLYLVWRFVIPLLSGLSKAAGAIGDVVDKAGEVAGDVIDVGTQAAGTLYSLPGAVLRAVGLGGGSSWKPSDHWTPESIAQGGYAYWSREGTCLTVAQQLCTWVVALLVDNGMKEAGTEEVKAFLAKIKAPQAYGMMKIMLLWADPNAGRFVKPLPIPGGAAIARAANNAAITRLYWVGHEYCLKVGPAGFLGPGAGTYETMLRILWPIWFGFEGDPEPKRPW